MSRHPVVTIRAPVLVAKDFGSWVAEVVGFPNAFAVGTNKRVAIRKAKAIARRQFAEARVRAEKAYRQAGGRPR